MFLEILKSFGTGLAALVAVIVIVAVLLFVLYWLDHWTKPIRPKINISFTNLPNWVETVFWIVIVILALTLVGYDLRAAG